MLKKQKLSCGQTKTQQVINFKIVSIAISKAIISHRCQFCRFQKCLSVGMVKEVVRTDSLKGYIKFHK